MLVVNGWSLHMHDFKRCDVAPLMQQLVTNKHRQLFIICGEHDWAIHQLRVLFEPLFDNGILLSKHPALSSARWPEHLHEILGQEFPFALYDGYFGVFPNTLAALSGTVQAGGVLAVILPDISQWASWYDPALTTWLSYGATQHDSQFLKRWQKIIPSLPISLLSQTHGATLKVPTESHFDTLGALQEQSKTVDILKRHLQKKTSLPCLLSADRGRGKTSALGFLVADMPQDNFIICAVQYRAVKSCFKHLAHRLNLPYNGYEKQLANLQYIPPDQLCDTQTKDTIVLVDEAAAIPVPILIQIEQQSAQCVFASTLIGYEGNGRGYTLKFAKYLEGKYPNYLKLTLAQPIRYNPNDPLEQAINQLFALDSHYTQTQLTNTASPRHVELTAQLLSDDESLLKQVFSLLVLAHYQTTVNDLRQLLDSPSQRIFATKIERQVVGICLVNIEGGLDKTIQKEIASNTRRPQGHLLAQQLYHVQGQQFFLSSHCARIIRIAIAPELHNRRLGSQLLSFVEQMLSDTVDYFGSSFGCEQSLLNFWHANDYQLVKLGYKKDKASGQYAAMVIKTMPKTQSHQAQLHTSFQQSFSYQLMNHYRDLPWSLVLDIISTWPNRPLPPHLFKHVEFLSTKNSNMEQASGIIWQAILSQPKLLSSLTPISQRLAISLLLQNNTKEWVQHALSLHSKKQFNIALQALVKELYARLHTQN